jgi:hypothetical protein
MTIDTREEPKSLATWTPRQLREAFAEELVMHTGIALAIRRLIWWPCRERWPSISCCSVSATRSPVRA